MTAPNEEPKPMPIVTWAIIGPHADAPAIIVLVVDDSSDDAVASAIAEGQMVPSDDFGGCGTPSGVVIGRP
jgi:hypothetical protein